MLSPAINDLAVKRLLNLRNAGVMTFMSEEHYGDTFRGMRLNRR